MNVNGIVLQRMRFLIINGLNGAEWYEWPSMRLDQEAYFRTGKFFTVIIIRY